MRLRLPLFTLLLVVALGALVALPATAASPPTTTLQFLGVPTSFNFSGNPDPNVPPKLGDIFSFHLALYKWNGYHRGAAAGGVNVVNTSLTPNLDRVSAVAHLAGGTLVIEGDSYGNGGVRLAVTGGTGIYAGARGEVITKNIGGPNGSKSAITIRLWQ